MRDLIISFAIDLSECGLYGQKYSMRLGAIGGGGSIREAWWESLWKVDRWRGLIGQQSVAGGGS